MASAQPKLRVIDGGGGDPRVAFGSVPSVLAATEADRIPRRKHRFAHIRVVLAIAVSCAVHAGVVVAGMQWKASDEARAEGGSADAIVMDGVSLVLLDSAPSAASDGAESLPEAEPVQSATAVQMAEAEDIAAVRETAAAPVTEAEPARPQEEASPAPAETAAAPLVMDDASARTVVEEAARVADAEVAPPTEIPPASYASGDDVAEIVDDQRALVDEEDTPVAAVDLTEPSEPPTAKKPRPPQEKRAAKPKLAPEPKPAPRSVERPVSVAEDTAKGPQSGTAGAGGSSKDERGSASLSSYQAKLAARLRSFRSFPAAAEKQGITGTAVVTFTVNASGTVTSAKLGRSSGHAILDSAAVAMVHRASPFPPIPANIGRSSITVSAPVRFDMR